MKYTFSIHEGFDISSYGKSATKKTYRNISYKERKKKGFKIIKLYS